jgi:hypothetical protein
METKQTAVQLILDKFSLLSDGDFKYWMINNYDELIEMEREQIVKAHGNKKDYSYSQIDPQTITGEQYYIETYGGQDE